MYQRSVKITGRIGLHARPASQFANIAKQFKSKITAINGERSVDAKSITMLLTIGAKMGDEIIIKAEGEDEAAAVEKLTEYLQGIKE